VLVVGAGPAGAAAAFFLSYLSEGKLDVLSLEKLEERYDRYHHMCGEAMSERAFERLSPLMPEAVTFKIKRAVEHWPGDVTIETETQGYVLDRPTFLRRLRERAAKEGCHPEQGTAVRVTKEGNGYLVRTREGNEHRCKWLVGADGWNSLVRRTLFAGGPRLLWAEQYVLETKTENDTMHFHYDERYRGGYRWVFPHPRGSRMGFTRGTEPRPSALERHVRAIPYDYREVVKGNACLVGDAGGQANPITFGGIGIGMSAAMTMARSLVKGSLSGYAHDWPRSPYASPLYVDAFDALRGMDNAALRRSVRPFVKGYGRVAALRATVSDRESRRLYRTYDLAAKWGW